MVPREILANMQTCSSCIGRVLRGGASHHGYLRVSDETDDGKKTDFP